MVSDITYDMLNREAGGRRAPVPDLSEMMPMSTYGKLQLIVSIALLIVAILRFTYKKQLSCSLPESDSYFSAINSLPGRTAIPPYPRPDLHPESGSEIPPCYPRSLR